MPGNMGRLKGGLVIPSNSFLLFTRETSRFLNLKRTFTHIPAILTRDKMLLHPACEIRCEIHI